MTRYLQRDGKVFHVTSAGQTYFGADVCHRMLATYRAVPAGDYFHKTAQATAAQLQAAMREAGMILREAA